MDNTNDTRTPTEIIGEYLAKDARLVARASQDGERDAALRFAAALRDPERVARLLDGIDAAELGKPRRHPVTAGHAA